MSHDDFWYSIRGLMNDLATDLGLVPSEHEDNLTKATDILYSEHLAVMKRAKIEMQKRLKNEQKT